jgi:hypothetical protein
MMLARVHGAYAVSSEYHAEKATTVPLDQTDHVFPASNIEDLVEMYAQMSMSAATDVLRIAGMRSKKRTPGMHKERTHQANTLDSCCLKSLRSPTAVNIGDVHDACNPCWQTRTEP